MMMPNLFGPFLLTCSLILLLLGVTVSKPYSYKDLLKSIKEKAEDFKDKVENFIHPKDEKNVIHVEYEEEIRQEGTLKPVDPFDCKNDSEILQKAMEGLGTDEQAIIGVMGHRSAKQREEIVKMFKTMYGKDLVAELKSETSGSFKTVLEALCLSPAEFDASQLNKAMEGSGADKDCLIEIMCTRTNDKLAKVMEAYKKMYGKPLEDDILSKTSGNLKLLLVSMLYAERPETNIIHRKEAKKDANELYEAGELLLGTDVKRFMEVLSSRGYTHLRATFEEYEKGVKKELSETIKSKMSGDLRKALLTIVGSIKNEAAQYAQIVHSAILGLGTNEDSLIRTCVTRCEIDMVQIKEQFQIVFDSPMGEQIADDITGDFKSIILALIGEEQSVIN